MRTGYVLLTARLVALTSDVFIVFINLYHCISEEEGGLIVKKGVITMAAAAIIALTAPLPNSVTAPAAYQQVQAAEAVDGMKRLNLILKKLRDAMGSMKDFDELEKAGLSKKDVDRMRRAMNDKIQQMMQDAIYAIRSL